MRFVFKLRVEMSRGDKWRKMGPWTVFLFSLLLFLRSLNAFNWDRIMSLSFHPPRNPPSHPSLKPIAFFCLWILTLPTQRHKNACVCTNIYEDHLQGRCLLSERVWRNHDPHSISATAHSGHWVGRYPPRVLMETGLCAKVLPVSRGVSAVSTVVHLHKHLEKTRKGSRDQVAKQHTSKRNDKREEPKAAHKSGGGSWWRPPAINMVFIWNQRKT